MSIIDLIRTDDFLILNRVFIRELGLNPAILLCELANQSAWFEKNNQLETFNKEDGYFYEKISVMEERTGLSRREQDTALKVLKDKGLIKCILKGLPAKRYFKIDEDKAGEIFSNSKSRMAKKDKVNMRKSPPNESEKSQSDPYIEKEKKEENKERFVSEKEKSLGDELYEKYKAKSENVSKIPKAKREIPDLLKIRELKKADQQMLANLFPDNLLVLAIEDATRYAKEGKTILNSAAFLTERCKHYRDKQKK